MPLLPPWWLPQSSQDLDLGEALEAPEKPGLGSGLLIYVGLGAAPEGRRGGDTEGWAGLACRRAEGKICEAGNILTYSFIFYLPVSPYFPPPLQAGSRFYGHGETLSGLHDFLVFVFQKANTIVLEGRSRAALRSKREREPSSSWKELPWAVFWRIRNRPCCLAAPRKALRPPRGNAAQVFYGPGNHRNWVLGSCVDGRRQKVTDTKGPWKWTCHCHRQEPRAPLPSHLDTIGYSDSLYVPRIREGSGWGATARVNEVTKLNEKWQDLCLKKKNNFLVLLGDSRLYHFIICLYLFHPMSWIGRPGILNL